MGAAGIGNNPLNLFVEKVFYVFFSKKCLRWNCQGGLLYLLKQTLTIKLLCVVMLNHGFSSPPLKHVPISLSTWQAPLKVNGTADTKRDVQKG